MLIIVCSENESEFHAVEFHHWRLNFCKSVNMRKLLAQATIFCDLLACGAINQQVFKGAT